MSVRSMTGFARVRRMLDRGEIVNPEASKEILAILQRCQDGNGVRRHLAGMTIANKTGALDALRSEVALVYSKGGRIAMAITVDDMPKPDWSPDNPGSLLISDLARILVDGLARPAPIGLLDPFAVDVACHVSPTPTIYPRTASASGGAAAARAGDFTLAQVLGAIERTGHRYDAGHYARYDPRRGPLQPLRRAPWSRVQRRPQGNRPTLLHERGCHDL